MKHSKKVKSHRFVTYLVYVLGFLVAGVVYAATDATIGTMASTITKTFGSVSKLITAGSYIAGLGFAISAIMKFKQHKDNPTQVQIGQPIGLTFIAAALLFLPSILGIAGGTLFGSDATSAGSGGISDLKQ